MMRSQIHNRYVLKAMVAGVPPREAANYEPHFVTFPKDDGVVVAARNTFEGRVLVLPETVVVGISIYSQQPDGFKLQILDLGTNGAFFQKPIHSDNLQPQLTGRVRSRIHLLSKPRIVTEPGLLSFSVNNLSASANAIQVVLHCAQPTKWRANSE